MNELQKTSPELTPQEIEVLVQANIIPKGTPEPMIKAFAKFCNEKNLSPVQRQIYLIPRKDKMGNVRYTFQTAIDGFRAVAERTGTYAGNEDYIFDEGLTEYQMIKESRKTPTTATAIVHKMVSNQRCPFSATARWEEYFPGDQLGFMWKKMPFLMLGKCAEALALRKAFPEALGGIYSDEEMQQADVKVEPLKLPETKAEVRDFNPDLLKCNSFDDITAIYNTMTEDEKKEYYNLLQITKRRIYKENFDTTLKNMKKNHWTDKKQFDLEDTIEAEEDPIKKAAMINKLEEKVRAMGFDYTFEPLPFAR